MTYLKYRLDTICYRKQDIMIVMKIGTLVLVEFLATVKNNYSYFSFRSESKNLGYDDDDGIGRSLSGNVKPRLSGDSHLSEVFLKFCL